MILLQNVTFSYEKDDPEEYVLSDVTLTISPGEIVGVIGHTGSGKSTLMQMIAGLLKPTSGNITVLNKDLTASKTPALENKGKVGLVFQYPEHQLFAETVFDDIAFGAKNQGLSPYEVQERVREAMELTGMDESLSNESPFDLSGGQKRRVAIAGVLSMHPEILILDEPAAGLDPKGKKEIFESILHFQKKYNTTVIFVSHSMEEVAEYADRVLVLEHGEIKMNGTPKEVYAHYDVLETMGLDTPGINRVVRLLREKGMPISEEILTLKEAEQALELLLRGGKV